MTTDPRRIFVLHEAEPQPGPVVYWMQRDQRVADNWALHYAQEQAIKLQQPLVVVFCLTPGSLGATMRQHAFMIGGLSIVARRLVRYHIPFILLRGLPQDVLPRFLVENYSGMLVTDFNPLRATMEWRNRLSERVSVPFHEVDAHNIIPGRYISRKNEYAAYTFRKKVEHLLPEFLPVFPSIVKHPDFLYTIESTPVDWAEVMRSLRADRNVSEVSWLQPGETAASAAALAFIQRRLASYDADRDLPEKKGQSDLSPYLHFGHLSAQRLAFEVQQSEADAESKKKFLEVLIVHRELAENFCHYNPNYDNFDGFQPWSQASLNRHRNDRREHTYTREEFEDGRTHDPLWNAAQQEMVMRGKMHGFLRKYWAKKILEWTESPEEAMDTAVYLNDKYELDGRDPNGYAGIAWSIGGTHDRPWADHDVSGMVRRMDLRGYRKKFDVEKYINSIKS